MKGLLNTGDKKIPKKIEKAFEREYMKKGKTKKQADLIFYKWEAKHGLRRKK